MRVLVYPHSMEIGGSQTNAIELAGAVRDLGHDVVVYSPDGVLVDRLTELRLERISQRRSHVQPGPSTAVDLRRIVQERQIDVVHGYEWPPILEAYAATLGLPGAVCVGTIMSMAVAPFIPSSVPLAVGTAVIQADARAARRGSVDLIEPPVDTVANAPDVRLDAPVSLPELDRAALRLVIVSRLVPDLKLEGILSAIAAVGTLAESGSVQLLVVGGGVAEEQVRTHARTVNESVGRPVVVVAGEWLDPRWAYASADICIGMGGSALRAMAFGKPLIVQGEDGYFRLLTAESLPTFLQSGWYGTGTGPDCGVENLLEALKPILDDAAARSALGDLARRTVLDRFSLAAAAKQQIAIYQAALAGADSRGGRPAEAARAGAGLVAYKVARRLDQLRGRMATDDFNARAARDRR